MPLLAPSTDIKLKHGVLGLLKNLALTQPIRELLGQSGTIEALCKSNVWGRDGDIADMVQLSAIGVVKHLSTGHSKQVPNSTRRQRLRFNVYPSYQRSQTVRNDR